MSTQELSTSASLNTLTTLPATFLPTASTVDAEETTGCEAGARDEGRDGMSRGSRKAPGRAFAKRRFFAPLLI